MWNPQLYNQDSIDKIEKHLSVLDIGEFRRDLQQLGPRGHCVRFATLVTNLHWAHCGNKDSILDYNEELLEYIKVYLEETWGITLEHFVPEEEL
jgi:hypothetical protein